MFAQDSYLKRKLLKSKGFYIQHGEWDEHEHEGGGLFQGKQLLGVVSDGENHSGKQGALEAHHARRSSKAHHSRGG